MAKITNTISPNAEAIAKNAPMAIAQALYQQANEIMADSVTNYVPRDTGNLANSAKINLPVMSPNEVSVEFGYGGPAAAYALSVHENPRSGKTEGWNPDHTQRYQSWARTGEWKYLETPLKKKAPEAARELAAAIQATYDRKISAIADALDRMARGGDGPT